MKTQLENGLSKIFGFQEKTIYISDQSIFTVKDSGLHDEEGNKINISDLLTAAKRQSGFFMLFMMTLHPYQADPKFKHSHVNCRACIQLPLDINEIYDIFDTQML